jgi:hypothetical protein
MKGRLWICIACALLQIAQAADPPKVKPGIERPPAMIDAIAASLTVEERDKLLKLLGFGRKEELMAIPGIGEGKANAIIAGRPYFRVTDVTRNKGIGQSLFAAMVEHVKKRP